MLHEIHAALVGLGLTTVAVMTVLYVFYEKILVAIAWLLHLSFGIGLALSTAPLLLDGLYGMAAARAVETTGIPAQLRAGDAFVRRVQTLPDRVKDRVLHPFQGTGPTIYPEPDSDLALALFPPPPGALETAILPILQGFTAAGLRAISFALGVSLMALGLLFRSSVDLVLADRSLRRRVAELEAALAVR